MLLGKQAEIEEGLPKRAGVAQQEGDEQPADPAVPRPSCSPAGRRMEARTLPRSEPTGAGVPVLLSGFDLGTSILVRRAVARERPIPICRSSGGR